MARIGVPELIIIIFIVILLILGLIIAQRIMRR